MIRKEAWSFYIKLSGVLVSAYVGSSKDLKDLKDLKGKPLGCPMPEAGRLGARHPTGLTREYGHALSLGKSYAPRHRPTVGP